MIKKFVIWDADIELENWKEFLEGEEDRLGHTLTEMEQYDLVNAMNGDYLDDERANLNIQLQYPILVVGDIGLWNGRRQGYKIIRSGNIKDILYSNVEGMSTCKWYCDGYNICCRETHHDGVNFYIYRKIVRGWDEGTIDRLLRAICGRKDNVKKLMNYYTRSIAPDVGRVYGFCQ